MTEIDATVIPSSSLQFSSLWLQCIVFVDGVTDVFVCRWFV